jgi:hypothetical protein
MGILKKVKALYKRWFGRKRRRGASSSARPVSNRKLLGKRVKPTRTSSPVGRTRPTFNQPYTPRGGNYDLSSGNTNDDVRSARYNTESALEQLGRGAISTFGNDIQALLGDSKDVLKSLHGDFFSEKGYEAGDASRSVFKTFYDVGNADGTYSGLNRAWDPEEDAFTHSLQQRTTEILDILVSKDTLPPVQLESGMRRLNKEAETLSSRGAFGTINDPYIRRPGVGLIVDVIAQADREIVIDLYQLQNRTVLDALEQKVRDNPTIKLSVRLSLPDSKALGQTGFDILGPNLLSLERLRRVKESLGSGGDIELFVQDRKSHQKVMVTDKFGIIGSLNLTAPVGGDVNQAGSNYEVVRRLQTREYSEEQYRNQGMTPTPEQETLIGSSDKLYRQLQQSVGNRDALRGDPTSQLRLNQGQIMGAAETYDHLRSTLDLMKDGSNKQFYGILNQVFLLHHEDTMFNEMLQGEMGKFDTPSAVRGPVYKGIQTELLDLVIENRAFLAVDNRNYSEHVLTPMYERTKEIFKGTNLPMNSLEDLVGRVGFDRSNPITSFMARVDEAMGGEALAKGFTESYARQLLAMTSGNIRLTTVPMQHSKQYLVVEGGGTTPPGDAKSHQTGSSNIGPNSVHAPEWGMDPKEVERTNREFGLALLFGKTGNGPNALTLEEVTAELALARESFSKDWSTLTRTALGDVDGRPTSPWYEDKVDKVRLGELHARLTELTTSLGVGEVSYRYGGKSGTERTGLSLTMDARKLAGFGEGFERILGKGLTFRWDYTTLSGAMGADEGYVLDITSGRLISRSLIHNSSASNLNIRMEDISQGIGQDVLLGRAEALGKPFVSVAPNKSAVMNPIGTTLSLVSTLLLESTNRLLVWGPEQYLAGLGDGEKRTLVEKYLDSFTPGRTLMEAAGEEDRSNITTLMDILERRLTGEVDGALEKVRTWFPGETRDAKALQAVVDSIKPLLSSMAYGYSMEEHIALKLEGKTLEEARAIVSDDDMVRKRVQRAGDYIRSTGGLVDILVPLLETNPEFRLAVIQSTVAQTNPSYTEILTSGINALSGALTEPYLLAAQAWQYSGSQAWHRMPMYGVTEQSQDLVRGLKGTWAEVLATQALAIPREISPFSSLGVPGLLRGVAGGSNNEGTNVDSGLTLFGQNGTPVATIMHHAIASSMGVGFSTTRDDILTSGLSDSAKKRALAVFDEAGGDELLTYLFGGVGKVAQIPQRLKNAQGQRGMGTLSEAFREAVAGRGDFLATARAYGKNLRVRLEERLVRANPQWTPNQVQVQVDRIIPEQDTVLAAAFDMSVRGVMGGEQVAIMEAYERALMELGLNEEDFLEDGLGQELVRIRAISSDVMSTGMKGFTASSTYTLVQMAGMYSDYFYANPLHSQMEGNLRTTTKKVKASMLGVDWTRADGGGMELARAQDIVMFDTTLQKVIVVNHVNGTTKNYGLADLTTNDLETLKETLDDRGQRSVLEGMIENKGRETGRSSVSTITTTGWIRPGEDSREYLLSMKALPGGGRNQLFYDLTYVQAKTPNGGSRVDSGTSLFKGVAVFLTASYFEGIARDRASRPDTVLGNISAQDTFGLINPSNLKSFSLEHGGSLLRGGKAEQVLASLSEKEAAVAMLLAFGSNYMDTPNKGALSSGLYEALRGMSGVYGETALQIGLREGPELGASNLLRSLDKLWNPASMYSLMDITGDAMLSSLRSGTGIKSVLSDLLSKGTKSSQYLNVDDAGERQAATILTALDITRQLLRDERVTTGDVSMRSDAVEQLVSILGLSEAPPEAITHAMISGLTSNVPSVYMKMDLSYSSTKEPIGTKGTGALQNADLVRPFTQIAKEFSTGGDMSKMRVVLANMLVSTAITQTASSVIKHLLPGDALPIRSVLDPQLFTPLAMSQNLGIYGSGMEDITALKKVYVEYGQLVQSAIEERLTGIASSTGDIRVPGAELSTLLFDSADPSSNQAVRDILGTQWRPEYETSLSSIQDVGRRYELLASKPFAVGEAEAIASQMGHERGIFYLPAIVFDPMPSESGRVIARIDDHSQGTSFFIPGAEDLRTYGIQYGSYTDELVRSTLTLASAFSPGTVIGNIFSTLSKVRASNSGYVEFTPQEVKAIQEYYVTAYSITERIAEASAGTRLKLEMRTRGFVGTFAATLGMPQGMFLAPEEGMRGSGDVRDSVRRQRLEEVTQAMSVDVSKSTMRLLTAERDALMGGMGEKGTNLLQVINEDLEYISRIEPSKQREYAAARLWSEGDSQHVKALMNKLPDAGTVEAARLSQEIRAYTESRTGSEVIPNVPGVRSYRDIVGPRQGNEGNYYAVELGEQALRSKVGPVEIVQDRIVNPPVLATWLDAEVGRVVIDPISQVEVVKSVGYATREWEAMLPRVETTTTYKVGGEYYATKEYAMSEVSALDSNLRGQLSNAINAHKAGQWSGAVTGRIETYRIDRSLFKGLGMDGGRELLAGSVLQAKGSVDQLLKHLSEVDTAYGYGPQEIALIGTSRTELETLSSELDTLHKSRNDWTSIEAPLARMETLQVSLNTSDVLQATVFRAGPVGSSEIQRLQFSAVGTVKDLNQYLAGQGMTQLDEARNKTLGLLPALSAMTTTLNDFDGDSFTVIFSKIGSAMNDRQRLEDKVRANTIRMGMVRREAAASGSEYIDDYIATMNEYKAANTTIASRISRIDSEMGTLRDGLVETYDPLLRKEVASYMGISQSFLSEYQDSPIKMEVLPTYLQQGRGLFGGIEGVAHKNSLVAMHATMEQIYATEDFKGTLRAIDAGTSLTEALSPYAVDASTILQHVSDDNFKKLLTAEPDLREDFLTKMVESIQASPTREVSESLMYGAAQLTTSEGALSSYSKYMGMGSGASMAPTVYDMLTKTLGVAGGDILGKSYNALVGTLFRDSPLIALSHVLSSNTAMEGMRDYYRGTGIDDTDVDGQIADVHAEAKRAESLQGFMKSAQQLLRDSIKFKGDTNVLGELQRGHAEYEKHLALGDEDSARSVLNEMAGKLGPSTGPGLRSYMQLNTLVESSNRSLYTSSLSSATSDDMSYLNREYKIDSPESITRLTAEMRDRGYEGDPLVGDVVRYKVARDMRATITAFRYELGSKDNQPFLETVWSGMRGFLGTTDIEQGVEDKFRADPSLAHDIGAALSADANSWWGEASSKNKALMLALVDEGRKQTDPIFGQTGEGLKDFVTLEVLRKKATAVASGRAEGISGIPEGVMNADVTITMMNAAMGNKLTPEATASFMGVMMNYLGSDSKMDDILNQTKGGQAFLELSRDGVGEGMRVVNKADGSTRFAYADEKLLPGEEYRKFLVGGQEYDSPTAWVESAVEATAAGNKAAMLRDTAKAVTEQLTAGSKLSWSDTIQNALGASISESEIRSATISRLQELKVKEGTGVQEAYRQAMEEVKDRIHMDETRRLKGIEMREVAAPLVSASLRAQSTASIPRASLTGMTPGASQANHMRHSQEMHNAVGRMHDMNDMVLGAGLTLLGSLMATGSVNENTIGQVVGGTVSVLGYSQMGRPGVNSVLGQAFRARMAHAESKGSSDEGEWVRRWVGREVGFYMGAVVLAPAIMGGAEKLLSKFSPLRLDRPMDMDKYKNWKAAANTIGGAVLSSVLGMVTAAVGGHVAVHGTNLIPSLGVVENFVRNMADTESKRQDMIAERLAQVGEGTVMDGEGDPLRASIEVSYTMDNPTTDFSAYPMGESDYSTGDDWEVNVVG